MSFRICHLVINVLIKSHVYEVSKLVMYASKTLSNKLEDMAQNNDNTPDQISVGIPLLVGL